MIVKIRTISGSSFNVEVAEDETVAALKEKVAASCPGGVTFDTTTLTLIHKGKILNDGETVRDAKIEEGSFCVAMQRKGAPKENKTSTGQPSTPPVDSSVGMFMSDSTAMQQAATTTAATVPAVTAPTEEAPPASEEQPVATESPSAARSGSYEDAASTLLTGTQLEQNIAQICEMGFERSQVVRAMHAAYNNPDRAVEYLMNGLPQMEAPGGQDQPPATGTPQAVGGTPVQSVPSVQQTTASEQGQGPNAQPLNMFGGQPTGGSGGGGGGGGGGGALDFLRTNPHFNVLRHLVAQNPQVLQPMLQELGRNNPDLLRQINEHQQEFLALLTEEPPAQVAEAAEGLMQLAGQGGIAGGDPVVRNLTITAEEAEAIERLQSLGFDRDRCVEAFFICDKNEEIAANYLLEHADDA